MEEETTAQETADLQASLDRVDGERQFVVRNMGAASAFDVGFTVDSEREKNPPVSSADLARVFPAKELAAGQAVSVAAIITPGTGLHFRGVVNWKNADGSDEERVYYMSA